jgi:hypothetical protein
MELVTGTTKMTIGGQAIIISALKALLDQGIVKPIRLFLHATHLQQRNAPDPEGHSATPTLEDAAACIAAVVEAEHPATLSRGSFTKMSTKPPKKSAAVSNPSRRS